MRLVPVLPNSEHKINKYGILSNFSALIITIKSILPYDKISLFLLVGNSFALTCNDSFLLTKHVDWIHLNI